MRSRDLSVLRKMVQHAEEIGETITTYELDFDKFKSNHVMKKAIAMGILQIGELVGTLTDDFKSKYNKMPWRDIVGMRNRAAHAYGSMDIEFLWNTAIDKVPELKGYCEGIITILEQNE